MYHEYHNANLNPTELAVARYAILNHESVNHLYAEYLPYRFHLEMVVNTAQKFSYLLAAEEDRTNAIQACWLHDTLEDCRKTYNDLKILYNYGLNQKDSPVPDIVYAVTNEKGRNRSERANEKYYQGIRETSGATFVKLCDRIANATFGLVHGGSMLAKYQDENKKFLASLAGPELTKLQPMVDHLNAVLFGLKNIF